MCFIWRKSSRALSLSLSPLYCEWLKIMSGRLSPFLLLFKLSRLQVKEAGQRPTCRGLLHCQVSCGYSSKSEYSKASDSPLAKLDRSFQLLGVIKDDCTVEQIKKAYIDSAKRYHPDSNSTDANAEKFAEVNLNCAAPHTSHHLPDTQRVPCMLDHCLLCRSTLCSVD